MTEILTIDKHFQGPPHTGNGGYVCGLLGSQIDGAVEVTLRSPAPLDVALRLEQLEGKLGLIHEEQLVATAKSSQLILDIPECPTLEVAEKAMENYERYKAKHAFPNCFVCGYLREEGTGLRLFAGQMESSEVYATPWIPYPALADEDGVVEEKYLWSALDCPGAFAAMGEAFTPMVLGRMTGEVYQSLSIEEPSIVVAWNIHKEGRKHFVGTAIYNSQKEVVAAAKSIWFEIDPTKY